MACKKDLLVTCAARRPASSILVSGSTTVGAAAKATTNASRFAST